MSENQNELKHYGVLGMKWGIRRYENKDGTLTEAGKKHYANTGERGYQYHSHATKKYTKKAAKAENKGDIAKAKKFRKRAANSRKLDKLEEQYARKVKTREAVMDRLFGTNQTRKGQVLDRAIKAAVKNKKRISDIPESDRIRTAARMFFEDAFGFGNEVHARLRKRRYIRKDG